MYSVTEILGTMHHLIFMRVLSAKSHAFSLQCNMLHQQDQLTIYVHMHEMTNKLECVHLKLLFFPMPTSFYSQKVMLKFLKAQDSLAIRNLCSEYVFREVVEDRAVCFCPVSFVG